MSKYFAVIRKYFRKGLYNKAHLEILENKGVITTEERKRIENNL